MTEVDIYRDVIKTMDSALHRELREQGHYLTGALQDSIAGRMQKVQNGYHITGNALYYGFIVDAGVSPERIPFRQTGNGGKSKYIEGLTAYWKKRGLSDKEAKSAAFATAIKHKKEGMPSKGSEKYSKTGFRTSFIAKVENLVSLRVNSMVMNGLDRIIDKKFHETKTEII